MAGVCADQKTFNKAVNNAIEHLGEDDKPKKNKSKKNKSKKKKRNRDDD